MLGRNSHPEPQDHDVPRAPGLAGAAHPGPKHWLLQSDRSTCAYVCMQINQLFPSQLPFLPFLFPKDHKDPEKNLKKSEKKCGKCVEDIQNT